ncbi:MAG: DUF5069 domain-containing protein [Verrucomicrobiota bacterium]
MHRPGTFAWRLAMKELRSPFEKLAGCFHLARITDKIRLHLAGKLSEDYEKLLFHPRGLDGYFMSHFQLSKEDLLEMVRSAENDDDRVIACFNRRMGGDEEKKKTWNERAVNLGKPGHPMERALAWARKEYDFDGADPSIDSTFKLIDWDERRS